MPGGGARSRSSVWTLQLSGSRDLARVAICWEHISARCCTILLLGALLCCGSAADTLVILKVTLQQGRRSAAPFVSCPHAVQSEPPSKVFQSGGAIYLGRRSSVLLIEIALCSFVRSTIPTIQQLRSLERGRRQQLLRQKVACLYMRAQPARRSLVHVSDRSTYRATVPGEIAQLHECITSPIPHSSDALRTSSPSPEISVATTAPSPPREIDTLDSTAAQSTPASRSWCVIETEVHQLPAREPRPSFSGRDESLHIRLRNPQCEK